MKKIMLYILVLTTSLGLSLSTFAQESLLKLVPPSKIKIKAVKSSLEIKWNKGPGAKQYVVEYKVNDGDWMELAITPKRVKKATILGVAVPNKYSVRIASKRGSSMSSWSKTITYKTKTSKYYKAACQSCHGKDGQGNDRNKPGPFKGMPEAISELIIKNKMPPTAPGSCDQKCADMMGQFIYKKFVQ